MIEDVGALVDRIDDRRAELREEIAAAGAELERLDDLVAPLRSFVERPGPDPVAAPSPRGRSGTDHGRRSTRPESAGSIPAPRSIQPTGLHQCPDCDAPPFAKAQGLGRHRAWKHPELFSPKRLETNGKADHPARARESWPCNRCSKPFPTAELRDEHQAGCAFQARPPLSDHERGQIAGMGE